MEIKLMNENKDFYFCQIVNDNGDIFNCKFRKLCNFLKRDLYNKKSILEQCTKLDVKNNVILEMYGNINIYFSPSLYSYIKVKKNGNERVIWFEYYYGDFYVISSDSICHSKYGFYEALGYIEDLARSKELYVDNYLAKSSVVYRYGTGNLPTQIELDSDCPFNKEVAEILSISKMGVRIAELFEKQKLDNIEATRIRNRI